MSTGRAQSGNYRGHVQAKSQQSELTCGGGLGPLSSEVCGVLA